MVCLGVKTPQYFICIDLFDNSTRYVKEERELYYGTYQITHEAFMKVPDDEGRKREVPQTRTILHGYFKIIPCPLEAKFRGGNGKAIWYQSKFPVLPSLICLFGKI